MMLSRRSLLLSAIALAVLPAGAARAQEDLEAILAAEPFPVRAADEKKISYKYRRRLVEFETAEPPGTIIVDPRKRFLYFVLGNNQAIRYGASVGKAGRRWSGAATIGRMEKWPTWTPTPEHIAEYPKLVKWQDGGMPGGPDNPMGARALYLYQGDVDTIYRIHGTHEPRYVGKKKTAGCFALLNVDIIDLYSRVQLGARVVVLDY
jgi:lipoprotein-anchoring transpeptidase ErfK/SrfK